MINETTTRATKGNTMNTEISSSLPTVGDKITITYLGSAETGTVVKVTQKRVLIVAGEIVFDLSKGNFQKLLRAEYTPPAFKRYVDNNNDYRSRRGLEPQLKSES